MKVIIHSYEGIEIENQAVIRFGMTREEVRSFFDDGDRDTFLKSKYASQPIDGYYENELQFSYDFSDKCNEISLGPGIGQVFFQGKDILYDCSYDDALNWLYQADPNLEISEDRSATSYKLGVVLGRPIEDPVEDNYIIPESLFIFEKGIDF